MRGYPETSEDSLKPCWEVRGISPKTKESPIYAFSAEDAARKWAEQFDAKINRTYAVNREKLIVTVTKNARVIEFEILCYMVPTYDICKETEEC